MKKTLCLLLSLVLLLPLCACGAGSAGGSSPVGTWYSSDGRKLDVRSDGSWILEGLYGSGTWKRLSDGKTYDLTDYYGEIYETEIRKEDGAEYLSLSYYGRFYRDHAPVDDTQTSQQEEPFPGFDDSLLPQEPEATEEPIHILKVDPFDGVEYDVSGISPFCQVSVNNQRCSEEAQLYVVYSVEGEYFSNGQEISIKAEVDAESLPENTEIELTAYEDTWLLEKQPFYIEDMQGLDLTEFIAELNDYVIAKTTQHEYLAMGEDSHLYY